MSWLQLYQILEWVIRLGMIPIILHRRFKPFAEDRLPVLAAGSCGLVAHPEASCDFPATLESPLTLAIGPEGGFVPYEIDRLGRVGLEARRLGERVLRVETIVPALLSRLG